MIKFLTLTVTITALALGTSFAECGGDGGCKKGDKKKDGDKPQAVQTLKF